MKTIIAIFCSIYFSLPAFSSVTQSTELLKRYIVEHIAQNIPGYEQQDIRIQVENIDPRLHLPFCKKADLQIFNPYSTALSQTNTMGIRCTKPHAWTLYVPVSIAWFKNVVTAGNSISMHSKITIQDLSFEKLNVNQLHQGYFTDMQAIAGQVSIRAIQNGTVITPSSVSGEKLVKRGQQVSIIASNAGFSVRMQGEALNDGKLDDIIKVRNSTSKRIIQAKVNAANEVKVTV